MDSARVRVLVNVYYDVQDVRLGAQNRVRAALEHGMAPEEERPLLDWVDQRMERQEAELKSMILAEIRDAPLWTTWLKDVLGVGPCIGGGLMAWAGDCARYGTVSKFWAVSGLHVILTPFDCPFGLGTGDQTRFALPYSATENPLILVDEEPAIDAVVGLASEGRMVVFEIPPAAGTVLTCSSVEGMAPRHVKGVKSNWNPTMRVLAWKAGKSFAMSGGDGEKWKSVYQGQACYHAHPTLDRATKCGENRAKKGGGGSFATSTFTFEGGGYRRIYDEEKVRLRRLHPEPVPYDPPRFMKAKRRSAEEQKEYLSLSADGRAAADEQAATVPLLRYSDGHVDAMARRKTVKVFWCHYWQQARALAGLPTPNLYVEQFMGHTGIIPVVTR